MGGSSHKPLLAILGSKKNLPTLAAARLQRWALLLQAYQYHLEFRPSGQHGNADGLSRLPLKDATAGEEEQTLNELSSPVQHARASATCRNLWNYSPGSANKAVGMYTHRLRRSLPGDHVPHCG